MVSHDLEAALNYASKILHLRNEQLFFGTLEEYRESQIGKIFLKDHVNA